MDGYESWKKDLESLKERLDRIFPEGSRAKSIVKTKLDEARLWAAEVHSHDGRPGDGVD